MELSRADARTVGVEPVFPQSASVPRRLLDAGLRTVGPASDCIDAVRDAAARCAPFAALGPDDIARLCDFMTVYEADPAVTLFAEGDPADFVVLVISGLVDLLRRNRNLYPTRLGVAQAGEAVGEMSMFDEAPRFSACVALESTRIAVLPRESLERLLLQDPALGNRLLLQWAKLLSQRLRDTGSRLFTHLEAARAG